jgi:hypothetical protein
MSKYYKAKDTPFIPRTKKILYKGVLFPVYSIGWLAHLTNRVQKSIRQWERDKILPRPIMDANDGKRWYLAAEIMGYVKIVQTSDLRPGVPGGLKQMGKRCQEFRSKLISAVEHNIDDLVKDLPLTESIIQLQKNAIESRFKKAALKILDMIPAPVESEEPPSRFKKGTKMLPQSVPRTKGNSRKN